MNIARLTLLSMSCAAAAACSATKPVVSDFCQLVRPHVMSEATIGVLQTQPADLDWVADTLKTRRCLCTDQQDGCPE